MMKIMYSGMIVLMLFGTGYFLYTRYGVTYGTSPAVDNAVVSPVPSKPPLPVYYTTIHIPDKSENQ